MKLYNYLILIFLSLFIISTFVYALSESFLIEQSGDKFNLGQTIYGLTGGISDTYLPILLANQVWVDSQGINTGTYNYQQFLDFYAVTNVSTGKGTAGYVYQQDSNRDNKPVDDYLFFDNIDTYQKWVSYWNGTAVVSGYINYTSYAFAWNYTLDILGSEVKVKDASDIEGTVLTILGTNYTIADATVSNTSYGMLDKLILLGGNEIIIFEGETKNGVTVTGVDVAETKCIIQYDSTPYIINLGEIQTMPDGLMIGVLDVTYMGAGLDICELALGAKKIILEQNKEVEVNGIRIVNTTVSLNDGTTGFNQLSIVYIPTNKTYLKAGESLKDPVFNAFAITLDKIVESTEEIKIDPQGDKVKLTVKNKLGNPLNNFTICHLNGTKVSGARSFVWGDVNNPFIAWEGAGVNITNNTMNVARLDQMTGIRFLAEGNKESHIYEIINIDTSANETDIKELDTGYIYYNLPYYEGRVTTFSDINYNIQLAFDQDTSTKMQWINFTHLSDAYGMNYWTKNGGNITFGNTSSMLNQNANAVDNCSIKFGEVDVSKESGIHLKLLNFTFLWDSTDDEIEFAKYSVDGSAQSKIGSGYFVQKYNNDSYTKTTRTEYGTKVDINLKNDGEAIIYYPDEATYAEVKIYALENPLTPIGGSGGGGGGSGVVELIKSTNKTGVNAISLPPNTGLVNAEDICDSITYSDAVTKWDPYTQMYSGHPCGTPVNNFNLEYAVGYFVSITQNSTWSLQ
ncbi:MAG: hypothetical protein WC413_01600 [Candidatus Nanoarchaeia archaeon]